MLTQSTDMRAYDRRKPNLSERLRGSWLVVDSKWAEVFNVISFKFLWK